MVMAIYKSTIADTIAIDAATFADINKILVAAPHPDDETLGCGGLIARLAELGRSFFVLFITDGAASHRGSHRWPRERVVNQRKQETTDALRRLGLSHAVRLFLDLPDANMPAQGSATWKRAVVRVGHALNHFQPDLVLLPWRRDPHCDHRNSWQLMQDALHASGQKPRTWEYTIWLEELGVMGDWPRVDEAHAITFDVGNVLGRKHDALSAYKSQTTALISDDPDDFRLSGSTIARLTGPFERYWRVGNESD